MNYLTLISRVVALFVHMFITKKNGPSSNVCIVMYMFVWFLVMISIVIRRLSSLTTVGADEARIRSLYGNE
jgi:hypothetical protein